jgi:hypothetical protein
MGRTIALTGRGERMEPAVRSNAVLDGMHPSTMTRGMCGESERLGIPGCVVTKGLIGKVVKLASLDVTLELAVPSDPVVFQKPSAELRELLWGERLDISLDLLDVAHDLCADFLV